MMFRSPRAALLLALSLFAVACGGAQRAPAEPRGTLRFDVKPSDALVEVDETRIGPASALSQHGLLLKVGEHRVVVSRPDHFTEYRLVTIREGEVSTLSLVLKETPE